MRAWHLIVAAAVIGAVLGNRRALVLDAVGEAEPVPLDVPSQAEAGQGGGYLLQLLAAMDPLTYLPTMTDPDTQASNLGAFLRAIRMAEGTAGANGYRTMFGGRLFDGWADHPRRAVQFTDKQGRRLWTSAAGAYQFMAVSPIPGTDKTTKVDTWDRLKRKLDLPDFSPASQDAAAVELIAECGALADVQAGRFELAIDKCRRVWASLPGAGYAQPEKTMDSLLTAYLAAGGQLA